VVDDVDGRARILRAALTLFARDGDATIRGVAAAAGVSPALVQHYFVTKSRLRKACDDHVLAYFREHVTTGIDEMGITDADFIAEIEQSSPVIVEYLARILLDATPAAAEIFDALVELTKRYLAADGLASVADRAAVLVAMKLGTLVLRAHLDRSLGVGAFDPEGRRRRDAAELDLLNPNLADPAVMAAARKLVQEHAEAI